MRLADYELAEAPSTVGLRAGLVLQRLPLGRDLARRSLYFRADRNAFPGQCRAEDGGLAMAAGATLSFDTYFGAFFEPAWHRAGLSGPVALDLRARGSAALHVYRRLANGDEILLHERVLDGIAGLVTVALPPPIAPAGAGRLFAEVAALEGGCTIEALEWRAPCLTDPRPVGLVPVFCTFGRERQLGEVLATLAAEPDCWEGLPRILIVNQGRPGLAAHSAMAALPDRFRSRLTIVEQGNFGGAGGFTRGMIEARSIPGATHVLLMDDDVGTEPEALRRAAAFFAVAHPRAVLGGHMLDMLKPSEIYEAGARLNPGRWAMEPLKQGLPLGKRATLDALTRPQAIEYNGWWFFGLPIALMEEAGLPLPCFIRGDDVEYGLRLAGLGAPILDLPGAAIWHEPFYAKLNGWQLYYETRNMLVAGAVHMPKPPHALISIQLKRILNYLLTYRYYTAALVLDGIEDYLRGPAVFETSPMDIHKSLERHRAAFPAIEIERERLVADARVAPDMGSVPVALARLCRAVLRNWFVPSAPPGLPPRLPAPDLIWFRVTQLDAVAADTGWDAKPPVFRRSRSSFRRLLLRGGRLLLRLAREGNGAAQRWQEAYPRLTSTPFWRGYLGLDASRDR